MLPAQCDVEKLRKKLFGENDVEAVLQRFDRLTQEEAKTTAAQTLEVAYRLVKSMKEVMDGAQAWVHFRAHAVLNVRLVRWKGTYK